jgi:hypothetical protein
MGASRHEERARRAHAMPPTDLTMTQEATLTGGRCLGGIEPVRNVIFLEQAAQARDQDPWGEPMTQALAGRNCPGIPSTRDDAPGLRASVAHPLGAPHAPEGFPGQTPPRHPLRQCIMKLTGSSRGKSPLGRRHFLPYARPKYYIV